MPNHEQELAKNLKINIHQLSFFKNLQLNDATNVNLEFTTNFANLN